MWPSSPFSLMPPHSFPFRTMSQEVFRAPGASMLPLSHRPLVPPWPRPVRESWLLEIRVRPAPRSVCSGCSCRSIYLWGELLSVRVCIKWLALPFN